LIENGEIDAGVGNRLDTRRHAVVDELIHPARFFRRNILSDVEVANGATNARRILAGVEAADQTDAALTAQDRAPSGVDGATDGRDDAQPRHNDATFAHDFPKSQRPACAGPGDGP
jgi:type IV secretory pathway TrbL component